MSIIVTLTTLVTLISFLVIIILMSRIKGKLGINIERVNCPRCFTEMPSLRIPTSLKQTMWGGWSCKNCGSELDKYGSLIDEDNQKEVTKRYIAENYGVTPPVAHFDNDKKTPLERVLSQQKQTKTEK